MYLDRCTNFRTKPAISIKAEPQDVDVDNLDVDLDLDTAVEYFPDSEQHSDYEECMTTRQTSKSKKKRKRTVVSKKKRAKKIKKEKNPSSTKCPSRKAWCPQKPEIPPAYQLQSHTLSPERGTKFTPYTCRSCTFNTKRIANLEHHLRQHDHDHHLNFSTVDTKPPAECFTCERCNTLFYCQQYFELHMAGHIGTFSIKCHVCDLKCPAHLLQLHLTLHTNSDNIIQCPNCSFCCCNRNKYLEHLMIHKVVNCEYACDICPEKYKSPKPLLQHYHEVHQAVEKLVCGVDNCKKEFYLNSDVTAHRQTHSETGQYCHLCGKKISFAAFPRKL